MTKELTITHPHSNGYEHYLNVKFDKNDIILNDNIIFPKEVLNKLFIEHKKYERELNEELMKNSPKGTSSHIPVFIVPVI